MRLSGNREADTAWGMQMISICQGARGTQTGREVIVSTWSQNLPERIQTTASMHNGPNDYSIRNYGV